MFLPWFQTVCMNALYILERWHQQETDCMVGFQEKFVFPLPTINGICLQKRWIKCWIDVIMVQVSLKSVVHSTFSLSGTKLNTTTCPWINTDRESDGHHQFTDYSSYAIWHKIEKET